MSRHDHALNTSYEHISLDDRIDAPQEVYNNEAQGLVYPSLRAQGHDAPPAEAQKGGYQELNVQPSFFGNAELRLLRARRKAIRRKALLMVCPWLLGVMSAVAHHLYNSSRNGESATNPGFADQTWAIRFGTGFAFLTISLLSTAVTVAFHQLVWYSVQHQRKGFSLAALDDLFALNRNLASFLSKEILTQATGVFIVGMFIWLLPLSAIPTPGTLSVGFRQAKNETSTCEVPSLNFLEFGASSSSTTLNDTAVGYTNLALIGVPGDPGAGAEFSSFSPAASRLGSAVAFSGNKIPFKSPCGANCSYSFEFVGPTWDCQQHDWNASDTPWYVKHYTNRLFYNFDPSVYYNGTQYTSNHSGVIHGEFWAAWAYHNNDKRVYAPNGLPFLYAGLGSQVPGSPYGPAANDTTFKLRSIQCTDYNATISVDVSFINNIVSTNVTKITLINPANYTLPDFNGGNLSSNPNNNAFANYAIHALLASILSGDILIRGSASTISYESDGDFTSTNLVEPWVVFSAASPGNYTEYFAVDDLLRGFEDLHNNITLSLLGQSEWIYSTTTTTQCLTFHSRLVFIYEKHNREELWACYAVALLSSGLIVAAGLFVMYTSREAWDISFSRFILTTRNPGLDQVLQDMERDEDNPDKRMQKVKLQFGRSDSVTSSSDGRGFYPSVVGRGIGRKLSRKWPRRRTATTSGTSGLGTASAFKTKLTGIGRKEMPVPPSYRYQ